MDEQPALRTKTGTRELILDAARAEIAEYGYDGATVRSIARRAGVDPRLIRYYFANKRRLATEALGELDLLAALGVERGELCTRLSAVWDRYPVEWQAQLAGAASNEPEIRAVFVAAVNSLVAHADFPNDPDGLLALTAFSQLIGIWMLTSRDPTARQRQVLLKCANRVTMRTIFGDPRSDSEA